MTDPLARRADAIQAVIAALTTNGKLDAVAAGQVDALAVYIAELVTAELGRLEVKRMRFEAASRNQAAILSTSDDWRDGPDTADAATRHADALLKRLGYEAPADG